MKKILYLIFFTAPFIGFSQSNEEFKQLISSFVAAVDTGFERKDLNLNEQNIGSIGDQDHEWSETFMLKSKNKASNNLDNRGYKKMYFNFFTYPDVTERDYAMKYWLSDFIDHQSVRPGRMMRTYPSSQPTIVVINETNIAILTYPCKWEEYDDFKDWRKIMLTWFGTPESVMIEVNCGGPLDWTKNPPDPKDRSWR